jgi:acyl carrier protein
MDIKNKILEIINEVADENDKQVVKEYNDKLDLRNDFNLDSLDLAELTVRIEEEFDVDIFADGLIEKIDEIVAKLTK